MSAHDTTLGEGVSFLKTKRGPAIVVTFASILGVVLPILTTYIENRYFGLTDSRVDAILLRIEANLLAIKDHEHRITIAEQAQSYAKDRLDAIDRKLDTILQIVYSNSNGARHQ